MAHKNFLKTCLTLLAIATTLVPNMVFAATAGLKCPELNDPAKTKDWIITILEEQFTGKKSDTFTDQDLAVADCLRVTTVVQGTSSQEGGSAQQSKSEYQDLSACPSGAKCQRVQVLMAKSGTALLYGYIGFIYRWAAATIGMVCVGMLVYYGTRIAASGSNESVLTEAKDHIVQSLGGLILLFLSAVILYTINPNFFVI
jgi:hypothetical protein